MACENNEVRPITPAVKFSYISYCISPFMFLQMLAATELRSTTNSTKRSQCNYHAVVNLAASWVKGNNRSNKAHQGKCMSKFKLVIKDRDMVCKHNDDKGTVFMLHKLVNDLIENLAALNATI